MKMKCNRQLLTEAVANVSRAVSPKNTLAALEGILLKAHGTALSLTCYDLELAISTSIDAQVEEEGDIILSAKIFLDMIRRMGSEDVEIACDEKYLTLIRGDVTEYTILGIPAADFPELPVVTDTTPIPIDKATLKEMISQTLFAVATNDAKPVHTGSLFESDASELRVVSVDGYRLALRREPVAAEAPFTFVVPGKSLSEVSKLIRDEEGEMSLHVSKRHIIFEIEGYRIVSRLLEGEFLDYKATIPEHAKTEVRVSVREIISAIDRASLLISDNIKSPLRLHFCGGTIKITCSTALGRAYDELACMQEGDDVEIGVNSRYLLDALKAGGGDEIRMALNGPLAPIKLLPVEGDSFVFLVLPVRLKSE